MPPGDDQIGKLSALLGPLTCEVELPTDADFFARSGPMPTCPDERRRFPRIYLRGSAAVQCRQSLPALPRVDAWYKVYTMDFSRAGVAFLHSEPLYPKEQLALILPDGKPRLIEVVRCRRIQGRCFQIAAKFVAEFRESAPS